MRNRTSRPFRDVKLLLLLDLDFQNSSFQSTKKALRKKIAPLPKGFIAHSQVHYIINNNYAKTINFTIE